MQKTKLFIGIFLLTALLLAACSGGQPANNVMDDMKNDSGQTEDSMNDMANEGHADDMDEMNNESMEDKDDDMMEDKDDGMNEEKDDMGEGDGESSMASPDWYAFEFTDAVTGETFSISQFKGQVVLVETMATWCSNCLKQQKQVLEFHNLLGERDDFQSIGISVELDMDPVRLGMYVENYSFDWLYGIADKATQESIVASFGGQYLNPPATPMFLVDKDGGTHELPLNKIMTADELLAFVEPFLN